MTDDKQSLMSFPFEPGEFSLKMNSFFQLGLVIFLAIALFLLGRRLLKALRRIGTLGERTLVSRVLNFANFVLPGILLLYGLTSVSKGSVAASLLLVAILTFSLSVSLMDPARSLIAAILIQFKGEIKVGDSVRIGTFAGRVLSIGPLNIALETPAGNRVYVPCFLVLRKTYEIQPVNGGPKTRIQLPAPNDPQILEKLIFLCPFRKPDSDFSMEIQSDGSAFVEMETLKRDVKTWTQKYFENFLKKKPR